MSDNVCPWCFIGKRSIEKAIAELQQSHPDVTVERHWHPFFLNPNSPLEGINKREAYIAKFGEEKVKAIEPTMAAHGQRAGIKFSMGGKTGNTLRSHRLNKWAFDQGGVDGQDRVVETLFNGYFENEQDPTDVNFLASVAKTAGLDEAAALAYLKSDQDATEVQQEAEQLRRKHNISGVPFFIFPDGQTLSGGQQPEVFLQALIQSTK